jgi:hypothetical protein
MKDIQKRFLLFLLLCIPIRIIFVLVAKTINKKYLPYCGYIGLIISIGFAYIYIFNKRKTGNETFGKKIWWNNLRPIHSLLYLIFAYLAINKKKTAYIPLLFDVIIGLISFLIYHYSIGSFVKLW